MIVDHHLVLLSVDADAIERAARVEAALRALLAGSAPKLARAHVRECFGCSRMTAWRAVAVAQDMVSGLADRP